MKEWTTEDARAAYPPPSWRGEDDGRPDACGYGEIIESIGAPLVVVDDKDYSGDTRALVRDGERYGILLFGWGSCSGCDALQACDTYADLAKLRNDFAESTLWFDSAAACAEYIRSKDWELDRCYHREESERFIAESLVALA